MHKYVKKEVTDMKKYYKVTLYDITRDNGMPVCNTIGTIIIKKGMFQVKDIMTDYNLEIMPTGNSMCNFIDKVRISNCGHVPIVCEYEFNTSNYAVETDVFEYVENYDKSKWKEVYEEIQRRSGVHMKAVDKKVKSLCGKK